MKHYHKLDKHLSRIQNIIIAFLVVALVASIATLVVINQKPVVQKKVAKPTIALVNEDLPTTFNKQDYALGKNFVDSVSNDKDYNWQVVSRSVADRAYKEKSVDAVIYLPQTFSHDLLTLQDIDPTQAKVDYKVQHQEDELLESVLQNRIVSVLHDFNQDVVKMYYASVAGNIAEAESNMNGVVSKHENLVTDLITDVKTPFKESLPNYNIFISGASGVKSINQSMISAHNSFTEMTTKMLTQTGDSFVKQGAEISSYFDLQKQIGTINAQNGNKAIDNQAKQNQIFYFEQFEGQNKNILDQLSLFNIQERDAKSDEPFEAYKESFTELEEKVKAYNLTNDEVQKDLTTQISTLETKRDELLKIEKDLYHQFFTADLDITKDNYDNYDTNVQTLMTSDFAREGLAQKIQNSFAKEKNLPLTDKGAIKAIHDLISQISVTDSDYQLDTLLNRGSITPEAREKYRNELKIIGNYAKAYELPTGSVTLGEIPDEDKPVTHKMKQELTVKVPPQTSYISNVLPQSFSIGSIEEIGRITPPPVVTPPLINPDGSGNGEDGEGSESGANTENNGSSDNESTNENSPQKSQVKKIVRPENINPNNQVELTNASDDIVEYKITLEVALDDSKNSAKDNEVDESTSEIFELGWYNAQNNELIYKSTLRFGFIPRDNIMSYSRYVGLEKFDMLTTLFNQIDVTANLIGAFYNSPDKTYSDLVDATTQKEFEAVEDSVFNLYGNVNSKFISKYLSETDVDSFEKQGKTTIKGVIDLIKKLNDSIESLEKDKDSLTVQLPEDYFPTTMQSLQTWHDATNKLIDDTYQSYQGWNTQTLISLDTFYNSWKISETKPLEVKDWEAYNNDEAALYINNNNALREQINSLIATSNETSQSIAKSSQAITDNSSEFDMLVSAANTTQSDAQKVLNNTNKLADTGSVDLGANKNYYANFSQVLANTRTQGADTNAIYDFFAQPLSAEDKTSEKKALVDVKKFDIRWLLVFLTGLFGGMLLIMGWHKVSIRKLRT
ncbi:type VII secretion protein EsaA [Listeria innocua]|uniref:type VII secretion protein EsaA n=1 Tax=Listeria innocua TaxID=1642 RepID=UPI00162A3BE2|nr:type VII secretion protein EsaA [Listeria innocua]MBC1925526.1 type VII secretion protein EsaA [Listeria innocua]